MSRYCGPVSTAPILEAAVNWRNRALLRDGSMAFSLDAGVDTAALAKAIDRVIDIYKPLLTAVKEPTPT